MPAKLSHISKIINNTKLYEELENFQNKPNDWLVTIYFYTALHIIESTLADMGKHSNDHKERNKNVREMSCFANIRTNYSSLYLESRQARYNCVNITDGKVSIAKQNLEMIKSNLTKQK